MYEKSGVYWNGWGSRTSCARFLMVVLWGCRKRLKAAWIAVRRGVKGRWRALGRGETRKGEKLYKFNNKTFIFPCIFKNIWLSLQQEFINPMITKRKGKDERKRKTKPHGDCLGGKNLSTQWLREGKEKDESQGKASPHGGRCPTAESVVSAPRRRLPQRARPPSAAPQQGPRIMLGRGRRRKEETRAFSCKHPKAKKSKYFTTRNKHSTTQSNILQRKANI